MPYATRADLEAAYSRTTLDIVADRDSDGRADGDVIAAALSSAHAEVDAHIARRYDLPLTGVHPLLRQLVVDVAMYRLASDKIEFQTRYADAVRVLRDIASGRAAVPSIIKATGDNADSFGNSVLINL